ncbi:amino acid ABC transporter ATP-binding/permease protein [Mesorhizobium sp. J428]|uniref:amino acid ABC transporter ATP-binding/permease protein n=1 Tax=Mesorhizobium sp. J428 TaxID=2898440 RepID=UPI0021506E70|nr:amino acid ABC transporter ATP-binding/permease protein [Mesorhizobium sp. J428]MCR5857315.1 amino acid ABC transporter ATP-binding/permease protein [Mesorhizobium sp. J428]
MSRFRSLRVVLALFRSGNRRMLLAGAVLSLATALAGIALLGLSGWFIAATSIAGLSVATALTFDIFMPSAGIRLLALGRTASRYGERLATHEATLKVLAALRERVFRGWASPAAARTLAMRPSRALFGLTLDIDALDTLYLRVIVPVFAATGTALAVSAALGFIHPLLGAGTALLLLAAGLGIPAVAARRAEAFARRRAYALEALRSRTIDLVKGRTDLLLAGRAGAQIEAVAAADRRLAQADIGLNRIETGAGFALGVAGAALLAGVLLAVALLAERGDIGAPAAAFAVLLALASLEPFAPLRRGAVEFGRTLLAARRLAPQLTDKAGTTALPEPAQAGVAARLRSVSASYDGQHRPVLSDVSLTVRRGERVVVIGQSGAGKSTLLSLLAAELAPVRGSVEILPATLLTQHTELFADTLRGNLALARPEATEADMIAALAAAGLDEMVGRLPHGLDTALGEAGAGLSGGQTRRLALARVLLRDAPVWLMDEPTEGLDGPTARDVVARIDAAAANRSLIIATHIRREAELADRLVLMRDGRIVAEASRGSAKYKEMLDGLRPD